MAEVSQETVESREHLGTLDGHGVASSHQGTGRDGVGDRSRRHSLHPREWGSLGIHLAGCHPRASSLCRGLSSTGAQCDSAKEETQGARGPRPREPGARGCLSQETRGAGRGARPAEQMPVPRSPAASPSEEAGDHPARPVCGHLSGRGSGVRAAEALPADLGAARGARGARRTPVRGTADRLHHGQPGGLRLPCRELAGPRPAAGPRGSAGGGGEARGPAPPRGPSSVRPARVRRAGRAAPGVRTKPCYGPEAPRNPAGCVLDTACQ